MNNSKISLAEVWKLIQRQNPEVNIETDCKDKMKDIVTHVLQAMRGTIELGFLEMTSQKTIKGNSKFYQILGFDIMLDESFNAWLFEVNSYPSMDIFYHQDKSDGTYNKEKSEIDEFIKTTIFAEAARVLVTKRESEVFQKVYDSEEGESLYEDVYEIYKRVSGVKVGQSITISKFSKLAKYLPRTCKMSKTDLELLFKKQLFEESTSIGLVAFFSALSTIAAKSAMTLSDFATEIIANFE